MGPYERINLSPSDAEAAIARSYEPSIMLALTTPRKSRASWRQSVSTWTSDNAWAVVILVAYGLGAYALGRMTDLAPLFDLWRAIHRGALLAVVAVSVCVLLRLARIALNERPAKPLSRIAAEFAPGSPMVRRLINGAVGVMFFVVLGSIFTWVKQKIPELRPFDWDITFMAWDRAIHGGIDPWRILHPVLGYPVVTRAIDIVYGAWLPMMYVVLFWQAFSTRDPRLRSQFFVAYAIVWVGLGNILATAMSSAGPCFYGQVTGLEDPFVPLTSYLNDINASLRTWTIPAQEMLWRQYTGHELAVGAGISAMPSVHVATAFLFVLLGGRTNRRLTIAFGVFAFLILIGSVHLGWHYAIDGYFAIAGTALAWWVAGRCVGARPGTSRSRTA